MFWEKCTHFTNWISEGFINVQTSSEYCRLWFLNQGECNNPVSLHLILQLIIYQCHFLHILTLLATTTSNLLLTGMNTLSSYISWNAFTSKYMCQFRHRGNSKFTFQYDFCGDKPWLVVCCLCKDLAAKVKKILVQNNVWTLVQWTQIQLFGLVSFLFEMTV